MSRRWLWAGIVPAALTVAAWLFAPISRGANPRSQACDGTLMPGAWQVVLEWAIPLVFAVATWCACSLLVGAVKTGPKWRGLAFGVLVVVLVTVQVVATNRAVDHIGDLVPSAQVCSG
ncbi:hypothetical protein [Actinokineospora sp. HUAS TT18]|uniref:hypothetical protein n=1 Tax=Actinokineospora sp. HUAS TT18 TaxID=3447451 RepID=UPI003F5224C9